MQRATLSWPNYCRQMLCHKLQSQVLNDSQNNTLSIRDNLTVLLISHSIPSTKNQGYDKEDKWFACKGLGPMLVNHKAPLDINLGFQKISSSDLNEQKLTYQTKLWNRGNNSTVQDNKRDTATAEHTDLKKNIQNYIIP